MKAPAKNALEWIVTGLGLALVLAAVGLLVYDGMAGSKRPPDLRVQLGQPSQSGALYRVPVEVVNAGDATAEGVQVEVMLQGAAGRQERARYEIAFVPRRSSRRGWVTFRQDPAAGRLAGRVVGYEEP